MKLFFTIVNHRARTRLKLSLNEFCVADSIYHLSNNPKNKRNGWCYMSQTTMGQIFGLSKKSIIEIEKRLKNKGLIEKDGQSKRTTEKWYNNVILDDGVYYPNESLEEIKCFYCSKTILEVQLEVDHFISKANGGTDNSDNLVLACISCNAEKKEMNGDDFLRLKGKLVKYPKGEESSLSKKWTKSGEKKERLSEKRRNITFRSEETSHNSNKDSNKDKSVIIKSFKNGNERRVTPIVGDPPSAGSDPAGLARYRALRAPLLHKVSMTGDKERTEIREKVGAEIRKK